MHESQNTEFKSSWHDDYLKWICGFANACFLGGYIDDWGRGTLKIINACNEAGLPEPEIMQKNGGVSMTLFVHTSPSCAKCLWLVKSSPSVARSKNL